MLIVYIVLSCFAYEGCDIEAVFSSRGKAEKYVAEMEEPAPGEGRQIERWLVDANGGDESD